MVFFYVIKTISVPISLQGVSRKMCLTVKMNIDVDKYDEEQNRLKREANVLVEHGLLEISKINDARGEFMLTDKGELYVFQKILGPIVRAQEQGKANTINRYLTNKDKDTALRVNQFLGNLNIQDQSGSLTKISQLVLNHSMPMLNALDKLHELATQFGIG